MLPTTIGVPPPRAERTARRCRWRGDWAVIAAISLSTVRRLRRSVFARRCSRDTRGMHHMPLHPTRTQPARQPGAVAIGFEGKRNPRDLFTGLTASSRQRCNRPSSLSALGSSSLRNRLFSNSPIRLSGWSRVTWGSGSVPIVVCRGGQERDHGLNTLRNRAKSAKSVAVDSRTTLCRIRLVPRCGLALKNRLRSGMLRDDREERP